MPTVAELTKEIDGAKDRIARETAEIDRISSEIQHICEYRRLLFATGPDLEEIVKRSLEQLGAKVSPTKYGHEEYILEYGGVEHLMEVKGVSKSISLTHLRQLNDYLLRYEEDTGRESKGILMGNSWRNLPPDMRGTEDTPEFPDNVLSRAENWGISLVSSKSFFYEFVKFLEESGDSRKLLDTITKASGLAFPIDSTSDD